MNVMLDCTSKASLFYLADLFQETRPPCKKFNQKTYKAALLFLGTLTGDVTIYIIRQDSYMNYFYHFLLAHGVIRTC